MSQLKCQYVLFLLCLGLFWMSNCGQWMCIAPGQKLQLTGCEGGSLCSLKYKKIAMCHGVLIFGGFGLVLGQNSQYEGENFDCR